jgi:hypothetical protein
MNRISATDNIIIHTQADRWQMRINTDFVENVQGDGLLLEAAVDQPLRYTSVFARTRQLPKSGSLPVRYVQRVVLGWSWEDEAWHLGLLFEPPLSQVRGSRWCELAQWPDPEKDVFKDLAEDAGRTLARVIGRPFNIVTAQARYDVEPQALPLPPLPLALSQWQFEREPNGWLTFVRDPAWTRERVRRVLWYSLWTVVYILLAVATLVSDIALPRPEFLPYVGLVTAVLLVGLVGYSLYELVRKPRRIVVDPSTHQIWGTNSDGRGKPIWRMGRESIDSIYVSQVIRQKRDETPLMQYGEINLRLTNGDFYYLLNQDDIIPLDGKMRLNGQEAVVPLNSEEMQTAFQAAAAYMGEALNVPVWYDHRIR